MQIVKAFEFKAKCLHLMGLVNDSGEELSSPKIVSLFHAWCLIGNARHLCLDYTKKRFKL